MGRFSVRPFVHPSVRPSPLWASQPGLRPSQPSLKPETWLAGWLGLRPGWLGLRPSWMAQRGGRTDGQMNERKISFYRTSSPIGAAALPFPMKTKEKVEQGKGTADHLMPLGYLFLVAYTRLYKLVCWSPRPSIRPSIGPSRSAKTHQKAI